MRFTKKIKAWYDSHIFLSCFVLKWNMLYFHLSQNFKESSRSGECSDTPCSVRSKIEVAFFTRYSLFFTRYSLHFYSLLAAFLLVTRCIFTRYSLRFYLLLVAFVLVTRCYFTRYSLRSYLLFVAFLLVMKFLSDKV